MTTTSTSAPDEAAARQPARAERLIDAHVHIVGRGSGGTGCWLRTAWWRGPFHAWLVRSIGLPLSALRGDLDGLYVERLLELVRGSSLDAAVILAQEEVYDADGHKLTNHGTFHVPNSYVLRLAREHPEFLAGVSIHPARHDALEELDRCVAEGAVLMKCLPNCQNIDCGDRRYTRFWERMAETGLPLLAHTGGEYTLEVVRPEYADPRRLVLPLECGVTVIAAHCATRSGLFDPQYFPIFAELTRRFPRLYGDTSAFLVPNNRSRGAVLAECLRAPMSDRLIHGSDYPVAVCGHWAWARGFLPWPVFRRWQRHPNPIERDYQMKLAMGFPVATVSRINALLPRGA
jgi:predicted TIM-barrel fold metal-dependent hydrolase